MYLILIYLLFGIIITVRECRGIPCERSSFYRKITLCRIIVGILIWPLTFAIQLRWYLRRHVVLIKRKIKEHKNKK